MLSLPFCVKILLDTVDLSNEKLNFVCGMRFIKCVKLLVAIAGSLFILWLANKPRSTRHDDSGWDLKNDDVAIPIK